MHSVPSDRQGTTRGRMAPLRVGRPRAAVVARWAMHTRHLHLHLHLHLQLHLHMQPVNVGLINMAMDSWVPCLEEFTDYFKLHYTTGGRTCTCTC